MAVSTKGPIGGLAGRDEQGIEAFFQRWIKRGRQGAKGGESVERAARWEHDVWDDGASDCGKPLQMLGFATLFGYERECPETDSEGGEFGL